MPVPFIVDRLRYIRQDKANMNNRTEPDFVHNKKKENDMENQNGGDIKYGPKQKSWESQVPEVAKGMITPPSKDPKKIYWDRNYAFRQEEALVKTGLLEIPPDGLTPEENIKAFAVMGSYTERQRKTFIGYQTEERIKYREKLSSYLDVSVNNVGDPFVNGNFTLNTKFAERMILDYYASLWNAKWPSQGSYADKDGKIVKGDMESYWGYVLTMGSTEGNLYAMYNARDYLSGKMLLEEVIEGKNENNETVKKTRLFHHEPAASEERPNEFVPVAFYSQDTHYSIIKAMAVEKIETFSSLGNRLYKQENPLEPGKPWPTEVPSMPSTPDLPVGSGAIDVDKLMILIEFFAKKGYPILLVLNYGTTFKGAYDNIPEVTSRLKPILEKYGLYKRKVYPDPDVSKDYDVRTGFWIHVDGALGASYMPFVKMAANMEKYKPFFKKLDGYTGPDFDFRNEMVHSIVSSGHKWPGAPWPTGLYMTRQKYLVMPPDNPEYIGSPDTTFAGSRNGFSSLILWDFFSRTDYNKQIEIAMHGQTIAQYAYEKLLEVNRIIKDRGGKDIWIQHTPLALSLIFRKPNDNIIFKYSLCCETVEGPSDIDNCDAKRTYVHFFCMWDVTKELVDEMASDLLKPDAFPDPAEEVLTDVKVVKSLPDPYSRRMLMPLIGRGYR